MDADQMTLELAQDAPRRSMQRLVSLLIFMETSLTTKEILSALDSWGSIAHDDNSGFIDRFCPKAWILTQVSWGSENMRIVYILDSGRRHVARLLSKHK
jgi:hypothetical protein